MTEISSKWSHQFSKKEKISQPRKLYSSWTRCKSQLKTFKSKHSRSFWINNQKNHPLWEVKFLLHLKTRQEAISVTQILAEKWWWLDIIISRIGGSFWSLKFMNKWGSRRKWTKEVLEGPLELINLQELRQPCLWGKE